MPIKEGRCPNCGSILELDANAEKGHCLFCDAVFANGQAFSIAEDPTGHTFSNEPQPKYEGPSLDPDVSDKPRSGSQTVQKKTKKTKPAPPPVYIPKEPVKLPDIRLPGRIKLRVLLISLVVLLIVVGITFPVVMRRDAVRQDLMASLPALAPFALDIEREAAIWYTANNYLMAATVDTVTQDDMIAFFMAFCEKRAELTGLDPSDFNTVYGRVKVKLVYPGGGFLIDRPNSPDDLTMGKAVVALP